MATEDTPYEIGGRRWRVITSYTLELVLWMDSKRRLCEIDKLHRGKEEPGEQYAVRVCERVFDSGYAFDILGGVLIPENIADTDWTPQIAVKTAWFLRRVTDEVDQQKALRALQQFIGFLVFGLLSSELSHTAFPGEQPAQTASAHNHAAIS